MTPRGLLNEQLDIVAAESRSTLWIRLVIILYLTFWYPSARRGQMIAIFLSATTIMSILAGPLSGAWRSRSLPLPNSLPFLKGPGHG